MNIRKVWNVKQSDVTQNLIDSAGSKVLAVLLKNRGIDTEEKITKFLNPLKCPLTKPDVFVDMQKVADRITLAIQNNEHIVVYGDFDADGVTATSVLYLTLKEIGANVDYYIPDRTTESHGLNTKAIVKLIAKKKTKLIITVDCGVSDVNEVNFANGFKVDVIITDHHEAPEILPNAFAIINAKVPNSIVNELPLEDIESLNYLSGVGIAFKVSCKLLDLFNKQDFVNEILPIVAIGTIGDVVELLGENRTLVEMGLQLIRNGHHFGLQTLLKEGCCCDSSSITSENVAFSIVPRINAAGRLESPYTALKVLISQDNDEILSSVKTLNDLNQLRQDICDETFKQAQEMYEKSITNNKKSIVLFHEDWNVGIIGIVCSKLVETYNKPAFLLTRDPNVHNIIRSSCRSIDGVNVHSVLSQIKDMFLGFGGHKMAAGFSFDENKVSFEQFKSALNHSIEEFSQGIDFNTVKIEADMELTPEYLTVENIDLINKLQPFGAANPAPLFVMNDCILADYRFMGSHCSHLKLSVSKNSINNYNCVKWNTSEFNLPKNTNVDILFSPSVNIYNGKTSIQLILTDIHSDFIKYDTTNIDIKFLDHRKKTDILTSVIDYLSTTKKSTAIFLENNLLKKQLSLPESILSKVFSIDNIPSNIEQVMFFDIPFSSEDFSKILTTTGSSIVHLMNFGIKNINIDILISKLSGMIKYSISNLDGDFDFNRVSKALDVNIEIIESCLNLFKNVDMVDFSKINDSQYKILCIEPVELSKIKQDDLYSELEDRISELNSYRNFYLSASLDEIKKTMEI